eukprot:12399030-Karenia_brevis.AAC.1
MARSRAQVFISNEVRGIAPALQKLRRVDGLRHNVEFNTGGALSTGEHWLEACLGYWGELRLAGYCLPAS